MKLAWKPRYIPALSVSKFMYIVEYFDRITPGNVEPQKVPRTVLPGLSI